MIKRWIGTALALVCLLSGAMAIAQGDNLGEDDFIFYFAGQHYALGDAADALIAAIENVQGPMNVYEADSCMFSGKDKEFESDEIVVATYPIGQKAGDVIETIMVLRGEYRTTRNIGIGAEKAEVEAAYGGDYLMDYDQMIYGMNEAATSPILVFVLDLKSHHVTSFYMMRNTT